ncbi:MAG: AraC family transcriptional regulator [Ruminococcaceae bacterium]|nr:AraC family transcriptional regulator [Oscillospiraceae bacterium]
MKPRFHYDHIDCEHTKSYGNIHLYQIGDICCEPSMEIETHTQVCHEITLIVSGSATCLTNGEAIHLQKGDLHFCKIGDKHAIHADSHAPLRYFYMGFTVDAPTAHPLHAMVASLSEKPLSAANDSFGCFARFCNIFSDFMNMSAYSDLLVENELVNIVIGAYRSFMQEPSTNYSQNMNQNNLVHDIVLYIDQNIKNIDLLSDLSRHFSYSYNYLSHLFTATMQCSLKDYVTKKKFEIACDWLVNTDKTITEISDALSFNTIHTFSRAFKNHFGISPVVYRKGNTK